MRWNYFRSTLNSTPNLKDLRLIQRKTFNIGVKCVEFTFYAKFTAKISKIYANLWKIYAEFNAKYAKSTLNATQIM